MLKNRLEDYTESEMIEFLKEFYENPHGLKGSELTNHLSQMVKHLIKITAHPEGRDLIFNPPSDRDDSPDGVLTEIKKWRSSQGLSIFKENE
ncbi:bacteriocin immunity protein [Lelliottia sp. CFBP8978]|uniref:bacteriocin immunity protein n=1 Tax=Lelliottia sp. CFBP8978 TaxID=3096522 RepID=UPI002A69E448|nr:bacteriocin immunity protein [Lelliottia sp. CFBP8978]MDY1039348.1 bacteriocin immunity protein [Lelliottia sp. CFBP8978]